MSADRYGEELGPKMIVPSLEAAVIEVRSVYPTACFEGSTGPERTVWVNGECVGHTWPRRNDTWFLRYKKLEGLLGSKFSLQNVICLVEGKFSDVYFQEAIDHLRALRPTKAELFLDAARSPNVQVAAYHDADAGTWMLLATGHTHTGAILVNCPVLSLKTEVHAEQIVTAFWRIWDDIQWELKKRYFTKEGEKPWEEVSRRDWILAERAAGFRPKMASTERWYNLVEATGGFSTSIRDCRGAFTFDGLAPKF